MKSYFLIHFRVITFKHKIIQTKTHTDKQHTDTLHYLNYKTSQHASYMATSQSAPTLLGIKECIQNLAPAVSNPQKEICAICVTTFTEDENLREDKDVNDIVQTSCSHLYHRACLVNWFNSTNPKHNTCPVCRAIQFRLNPLIPDRAASRQAEDNDLDLSRLQRLIEETDAQFAARPGEYSRNMFLRIVESVSDWNRDRNGGNEDPISPEHAAVGDPWVMYVIGTRLLGLILYARIPIELGAVQDLHLSVGDWTEEVWLPLLEVYQPRFNGHGDFESDSEAPETVSAF
ncbi:hypothetical protein K505DRAFT_390698 [Melanomma pulvis-pyrius CBS 109.77]|uniref:RING-type domain-containing protein n=1 Tax=Melanomma pulvis-pyrius CBS 109.77 TaxID=1314802 RepID=A0A6A6X2X6_9PLEO|nr:hypothetical protein K505DRAFT_390698 [Melanomma pulvis-pyrius CBS 109.77]